MAQVTVVIDDPLGLQDESSQLPLLLGSYVRVEIDGGKIDAVEVPRRTLREGDVVYVATDDGALDIVPVEIGWARPETVLVTGGLTGGEELITSRMEAAVDGMAVRVGGATDKPDKSDGGEEGEQ